MLNNAFRSVGIVAVQSLELGDYVENVARFNHIILEVVIVAAVRQLSQTVTLRAELGVQVVEFQGRRSNSAKQRWKHGNLSVQNRS